MNAEERPADPDTLTRNWNELLQEIRVIETGVQILTGFLLTLPFSQRFEDLTDFQRGLYLTVLSGSIATTALVVAPAAFHRVLFRHRARYWLVEAANQCARAGLVLTAVTSAGVLFLVFDVVVGTTAGVTAFAGALAFFALLWGGSPLLSNRWHRHGPPADEDAPQRTA
ncbi:DUF6328 family protein [Nocardioides sp. Kera G14]|uniref:DUF6328 family protein n=1 Tax=Nocardioides sp. Kera G14 TaxID=2884264 RepID=UPI001D110588|nr:DUF6328 family protein [Nocardioides sp. Kera G14]UDY23637.1 DUF6328 family protein [Nocardioides sp. Kera G14]